MAKAGRFEIRVWQGGHPIWAVIVVDGKEVAQINSLELHDLQFAAKRARSEARQEAQRMDPKNTEEY